MTTTTTRVSTHDLLVKLERNVSETWAALDLAWGKIHATHAAADREECTADSCAAIQNALWRG